MQPAPPHGETEDEALGRLRRIDLLSRTHPARAAEEARAAIAAGLRHPMLFDLIARRLMEQGRFEEAAAVFGDGLKLDPDNAGLVTGVGFCLLQTERNEEARSVFEVAVRLDPDNPQARYGLGGACERCADLGEAEAQFLEALRLRPDHAAALAALASLATRRGDLEAARDFAARTLALDPSRANAELTLAAADVRDGDPAAAETRLNALLRRGRLSPPDLAQAGVLLGDALDALGRPLEAIEAYGEAKAEQQRLYRPVYGAPGVESARAEAERLEREFSALPPSAFAASGGGSAGTGPASHVFLVGFPRSGTTLLEQVLAARADVVTLSEQPVLLDAQQAFQSVPGGLARLAALDEAGLEPYRAAYWRRVEACGVKPGGKVFIDKMPLGSTSLPLVARLFPDARILFALRDPRDVTLSCFRRSFSMNIAMYEFLTLAGTARYYDAVMRLASTCRERLPLRLHEVRHEALVERFDAETAAVSAFLGLAPDAAMADFVERARERRIATPSAAQVVRGLNRDGLDAWRRYAPALAPVMPLLAPWIARYGYPKD